MEHTVDDKQLRGAVEALCSPFDAEYWREKDARGGFPEEFYRAVGDGGWLGIAMPLEYGGAGLGIREAALLMQTIAECGGAMAAASSIHMNIFGLNPVVLFGTPEQKARMLPALIRGEVKACFAVTEPNAGLDTAHIQTRAERSGDTYYVSGEKVWISTAQVADYVLLLARTKRLEETERAIDGLSLFYTKLDRRYVTISEIDKMGRKAVDSNQVFFDSLPVPVDDLIGEEGAGFRCILHGMNPERILIAAEAIGIGRAALKRAVEYARERFVFGRPIGQNQGIQHPLAQCWAELEAANLMVFRAAEMYDRGEECGPEANAAKFLAAEAAVKTCETAMLTLGGLGYAKAFDVERYLREVLIARIAPVSPHLALSHIAERKLGLPKSY